MQYDTRSGPAGLDAVFEGIARKQEQQKNDAKAFTSLVSYLDASGMMPKDRAITMSKDELEGFARGMVVKQANEDRAATQRWHQGNLDVARMGQARADEAARRKEAQERDELDAEARFGALRKNPNAAVFAQPRMAPTGSPMDMLQTFAQMAQAQAPAPRGDMMQDLLASGMRPGQMLNVARAQNELAQYAGETNVDPLRQFNAETARMNADNNRLIATRPQAGAQTPKPAPQLEKAYWDAVGKEQTALAKWRASKKEEDRFAYDGATAFRKRLEMARTPVVTPVAKVPAPTPAPEDGADFHYALQPDGTLKLVR